MENGINWELIAKFLNNEADDQELKEIEERIGKDPEYREIIESVRLTWPKNQKREKMIEFKTDAAWDRVKERIEKKRQSGLKADSRQITRTTRNPVVPLLRIAAALIVTAGLSYAGYRLFIKPGEAYRDVVIANHDLDKPAESVLPDGSVVFVKPGGSVSYRGHEPGERMVRLEGEAFFDVASNPKQPFIVETGQARVTVLGTSFSVHHDRENNRVNVFVESGNVLLSDQKSLDHSILIEPGFIGNLSSGELKKEINRNENYLAWKSGKLVFRETALEMVIEDLNRTYSTHIIHGDTKISNCKFTGTFYNQPVDSVVRVLGTVFNLHIEKTNSKIILSGEGCQ